MGCLQVNTSTPPTAEPVDELPSRTRSQQAQSLDPGPLPASRSSALGHMIGAILTNGDPFVLVGARLQHMGGRHHVRTIYGALHGDRALRHSNTPTCSIAQLVEPWHTISPRQHIVQVREKIHNVTAQDLRTSHPPYNTHGMGLVVRIQRQPRHMRVGQHQ